MGVRKCDFSQAKILFFFSLCHNVNLYLRILIHALFQKLCEKTILINFIIIDYINVCLFVDREIRLRYYIVFTFLIFKTCHF